MLLQFCQILDQSPELQNKTRDAKSPQELVAIAREVGLTISVSDLAKAAGALSASYWPWSGKGFGARKAFFRD